MNALETHKKWRKSFGETHDTPTVQKEEKKKWMIIFRVAEGRRKKKINNNSSCLIINDLKKTRELLNLVKEWQNTAKQQTDNFKWNVYEQTRIIFEKYAVGIGKEFFIRYDVSVV